MLKFPWVYENTALRKTTENRTDHFGGINGMVP
jgi:hypothetical protein